MTLLLIIQHVSVLAQVKMFLVGSTFTELSKAIHSCGYSTCIFRWNILVVVLKCLQKRQRVPRFNIKSKVVLLLECACSGACRRRLSYRPRLKAMGTWRHFYASLEAQRELPIRHCKACRAADVDDPPSPFEFAFPPR